MLADVWHSWLVVCGALSGYDDRACEGSHSAVVKVTVTALPLVLVLVLVLLVCRAPQWPLQQPCPCFARRPHRRGVEARTGR